MLAPRLRAIARLAPASRLAAVGAMRAGLEHLPDDRRQAMVATQMDAMATLLSPEERRAIMTAMDGAGADGLRAPYGPPRGLPRIPMALFRSLAEKAFPDTYRDSGVGRGRVALAGYAWHVLNGVSFGVMYTLLVGTGSWAWALAWGIFVWAAMMVAMPLMMPMIRFPRWFPVVPLLAHVAMVVPIGAVALAAIAADQTRASFLGFLL